ncbi:Alpha/Beta hydrolase protein [Boeremia exigua]|uniref:Alpha/Beta hydrolase protein n=1 Tax=Boeremia exigua TaxID=749465 RepID=UPI001E8EA102|nr:Alpha/Beta hydrolase protein [Boeremia exigua]KAH6618436.1 Alpha/Beta hydrolase protein [Boeremia exigua]
MSLTINGIDVKLVDANPPGSQQAGPYTGFNPSSTILHKGHKRPGRDDVAAFRSDAVWEKDVPVPMRDGVTLRADIFRPTTGQKVPAILLWSPYGKDNNGVHGLHLQPGRFGVPYNRTSTYEKFEGLDPAEWVAKGYAIVNFDLRGTWDSEGTIPWLGKQDGQDGYDAVEYIATLPWCSGKVATAGNSWLAMAQWFIAAEQPPHLAAIAPWEGASDFYRDTLARGGIGYPYYLLWGMLQDTMVGRGKAEAVVDMLKQYPLYNEYWDDKRAKLEQIHTPAYVLASYSTSLHTSGSIAGFNDISSKHKWLRIHPRQEWYDLYSEYASDDLQKFFDHYLKGTENGWEKTSKVRFSVLPFDSSPPVTNIETTRYPIPEAKQTRFYLASQGNLSATPNSFPAVESYQSDIIPQGVDNDPEELMFSIKFDKPTWLVGYSKAVLYLSADSADDLDVFVQLRKLNKAGGNTLQLNVPADALIPPAKDASEVSNSCFLKYYGPNGSLRASHAVTKVNSTKNDSWPTYTNDRQQKIQPGSVTRLEIPIWPGGMAFDVGESLAIKVSGHYMSPMEVEQLNGLTVTENKGKHNLHYGEQYESYIEVPLAAPFDQ